jgi:8-oxo-dGTP pyrophosphatase MutT (NUDIX family)
LERALTFVERGPVVFEAPPGLMRPSAVLVALFEEDDETSVVLTRRASTLRSHTHQVSFPGGRIDDGETPEQAAIREAHEEVGIDPTSVDVVGRLAPLATFSGGAAIEPIVGVLPSRPELHPNPAEVERAFSVPLLELVADGVHHEERWTFPDGLERPVHFFDLPEDLVWGATARILVDFLIPFFAY